MNREENYIHINNVDIPLTFIEYSRPFRLWSMVNPSKVLEGKLGDHIVITFKRPSDDCLHIYSGCEYWSLRCKFGNVDCKLSPFTITRIGRSIETDYHNLYVYLSEEIPELPRGFILDGYIALGNHLLFRGGSISLYVGSNKSNNHRVMCYRLFQNDILNYETRSN